MQGRLWWAPPPPPFSDIVAGSVSCDSFFRLCSGHYYTLLYCIPLNSTCFVSPSSNNFTSYIYLMLLLHFYPLVSYFLRVLIQPGDILFIIVISVFISMRSCFTLMMIALFSDFDFIYWYCLLSFLCQGSTDITFHIHTIILF